MDSLLLFAIYVKGQLQKISGPDSPDIMRKQLSSKLMLAVKKWSSCISAFTV